METQLKIYCDTNTLPGNADVEKEESKALQQLQSIEGLKWITSNRVRNEAVKTKDESKRSRLLGEHKERELVPKDEKIVGYNLQPLLYGGFVGFTLIADVQDEAMRSELISRGLSRSDAEHVTQAVCNDCDVFLTRDKKSIITPHREWLETRFPTLKVRLPSELLVELTALAAQTSGGVEAADGEQSS
jgi:predicted nucleic acid-binding protein